MVLSYLLTSVPLSLCHITGAMNKTDKSALMIKLEAKGTNDGEPDKVDVYLIDAMFFLRTLPNLPPTFGGIAKTIFQQACSNAQVVHIVCDTYGEAPSIKEHERDSRGDHHTAYKITGPSQQRPADFHRALLSAPFKTALVRFLKDEWASHAYAPLLEGHTLYFVMEQHCYVYTAEHGNVHQTAEDELESTHEEADTRLIFHAQFVTEHCSDTGVFILLRHHATNLEAAIWMDTGISAKNTRRVINITILAQKITPVICAVLPPFHAFTGCDMASFLRKGKARPLDLMVKSQRFTSAFSNLGTTDVVDAGVASVLEEYVCTMYGIQNVKEVNESRFLVFKKLYGPKPLDSPLKKY